MEDGWSSRRGKSDTAKARKIRKSRKLEQHRIHARWTFNDPTNIKESCPAVGQNHGCSSQRGEDYTAKANDDAHQ